MHRRSLRWQEATVLAVRDETPSARTFRLRLPEPHPHLAGQYYVVRLTAPDGYSAQRSYSVASAPDGTGEIELTVEKLADGEVSEFLHDVVVPGDELEVRGPIGGTSPGGRPARPARRRRLRRGAADGDAPRGPRCRHAGPGADAGVGADAGGPLLRRRDQRAADARRVHPHRTRRRPARHRAAHRGRSCRHWCAAARTCSCAARPRSATPPPNGSSRPGCPSPRSARSGSARPADLRRHRTG